MWPLILLVYVHLLLFGPTVQADGTIYKAVGSDVTLVPVFSGSPTEINWKVDGHKLVDMELNPLSTVFYRLKDRATINERNGELIVRNLNKGDSGVYRVEALANNVIQDTNINLKVLEYPAKPVITNRTIDVYIIELYCESSTANVKYEWRNKTSVLTTAQSYNVSQTKDNVTLTCVVSNEAFQNNSTVIIPPIPECPGNPAITNRTMDGKTIELHCEHETSVHLTTAQSYNVSQTKDNVTITCVVSNEAFENNSTVIIPPSIPEPSCSHGCIVVLVIVFLLVVLAIIIIFILCTCNGKRTNKTEPPEECETKPVWEPALDHPKRHRRDMTVDII